MSGIVAVFFRDGRPDAKTAALRAISGLTHDGQPADLWSDGCVALAAGGSCPRTGQDLAVCHASHRQLTAVAHARVDNIPDLAGQLGVGPARYATDTEWVLAAYEKWSADCGKYLIGDFVFAIWDSARRELVCGRDQLGSRPLVIHRTERTCVLASNENALLATGLVERAVNPQRIVDCLVEPLEGADYTSTFYLHVQRVPPAHILRVKTEGAEETKYWSLASAPTFREKSASDWLDGIYDHLRCAVAARLVGGRYVGSMLSGGMDSSAIVAVAREVSITAGTEPLMAISFAMDDDLASAGGKSADSVFSRKLAAMNGLQAERVGEKDIAGEPLERLFFGDPTSPFDAFMQMAALVYDRAQRCGLSAVLDGIDGDLVFGIHGPYLPMLVRRGRIVGFAREVWANNRRSGGSLARLLRSLSANAFNALPHDWHFWRKSSSGKNASHLCSNSIVRQEFAERYGVVERMANVRKLTPSTMDLRNNHVHWIEHPFATVGMERYQRVASRFGLLARHPLFDVRLLEYCVNLPWNLRTQNGWTKYGLRKSMTRCLPSEICWRREFDNLYPRVVNCFLKQHIGRLEKFVQQDLAQHSDILDVTRVQQSMRAFAGGSRHAGTQVWQALYLAKWLESA